MQNILSNFSLYTLSLYTQDFLKTLKGNFQLIIINYLIIIKKKNPLGLLKNIEYINKQHIKEQKNG